MLYCLHNIFLSEIDDVDLGHQSTMAYNLCHFIECSVKGATKLCPQRCPKEIKDFKMFEQLHNYGKKQHTIFGSSLLLRIPN